MRCLLLLNAIRGAQAVSYVNAAKNVATLEAALDGARAILIERFAEDAELIGASREAYLVARRAEIKSARGQGSLRARNFPITSIFHSPCQNKLPSHRILALFRGEKEDFLILTS